MNPFFDFLQTHGLTGLELLGTAAFAISGVVSALRKRMDVVGICVCGFLAAFGGGTLRDILLDQRPFFWVEHQSVLLGVLVLSVACATFLRQAHLEQRERQLQIPDAIGLGLFCATGVHLAWQLGQPMVVAILMGVITGTFGGVLRDVVCNEVPRLFNDHQPYALCALAGGLGYAVFTYLPSPVWAPVLACAGLTTGLRLLALWRNWRLPTVLP